MPRCAVCGQSVQAWKPHPHLAQRSEFMKLMETVGSDMAVYQCPACGCTDRDRHLWLYLQALDLPGSLRGAHLLHLAPERHLQRLFEQCGLAEYVKGDLFPNRPDQVKVDAQAMQFEDGQFDLIVCNHVLEHVPSPARVLAEFFRCLKPGGLVIAQTPFSPLLKQTFELKSVPAAPLATLLYGQDDHVRLFGDDIVQLFHAAGFAGDLIAHDQVLPQVSAADAGVNTREPLFLFRKPADAPVEHPRAD